MISRKSRSDNTVRITNLVYSHVPDNTEVGYPVFLQGLKKFGDAQMRFGS